MTVAFYHAAPKVTPHVALAARLITSVRKAMPGVPIWHLTDAITKPIDGVDGYLRHQEPMPPALARVKQYTTVVGDWLFVDTDVVIQRDVRDVFAQPFDIAVATREGTLKPSEVGRKFMARMPYNCGAVFSRSAAFWQSAYERMVEYSPKRQAFMGDQQALCDTIATGLFNVTVLPNGYNYPPFEQDEDVRDKAILHFKGSRKAWMLAA